MVFSCDARRYVLVVMFILSISVALAPFASASTWESQGWSYSRQLTVNSALVEEDQTDFPLLVDLTDSDMSEHAQISGGDILFTLEDEETKLNHEIELYDSLSGHLVAWVSIPNLSSTNDTILYMYYGNFEAQSQQNASIVWSGDYLAVHHLEENSGSVSDSTSAGRNAMALNGVLRGIDGKIGNSYVFDGVNDYLQGDSSLNIPGSAFTASAWVKPDSQLSKNWNVIGQYGSECGNGFGWLLRLAWYANPSFMIRNETNYFGTVSVDIGEDEWHHIAGVYDGSSLSIYVDGNLRGVSSFSGTPCQATSTGYYIGKFYSDYVDGAVDEIEVSDVARSQGYLQTMFNNQNDSSTFVQVGDVQSHASPPKVSVTYPLNNQSDVELNPVMSINIHDAELNEFSWVVEAYDYTNTEWVVLDSGVAPGDADLSIPTAIFTDYDTIYSWKITVSETGSSNLIEQYYNFRTRLEDNYVPFILSPSPGDNSSDINFNPVLSVEIKDIDEDPVNWSVSLLNGSDWLVLDSGFEPDGRLDLVIPTSGIDEYETVYYWRVSAHDINGSNLTAEKTYSFQTRPQNHAVNILSVSPQNGSEDVPLNPILRADISDLDGDVVDWTISLLEGSDWTAVSSGREPDGDISLVYFSALDEYDTECTWKVDAYDYGSGQTAEYVSSFRTRLENYVPSILNSSPQDGESAIGLDPVVSAYFEDKGGDLLDISFYFFDGSDWILAKEYFGRESGRYDADLSEYVNNSMTLYRWKALVADGIYSSESEFNFTTGGLLKHKYTVDVGRSGFEQILPVMGDVDDDGEQEIVLAAGDGNLLVINASDGNIEWTVPGAVGNAVELVDLNNDGDPEIIFTTGDRRVVAVDGDGSILWKTERLKGEGQPLFPLMAYDIDGDGYPTIYFASEDTTPRYFSGNMSDYNGAVTMLDHNGNVLADTWIYHPCWGGLAFGDYNYDGQFELYVSDRVGGYNGVPSQGLQAFDAHTLLPLWSRPDIFHSSPMAVVVDVTGDDKQEVIAQRILHKGVGVLNPADGSTIPGYDYLSRNDLPTHGTPTVYDVDEDGHMEVIMSISDENVWPKDFGVFDLETGTMDFQPTFTDFWVAWPPEVGDVGLDQSKEILAATGTQHSYGGDYPLLIYDKNYNLIDKIDFDGMGQLGPARVFDVDNDGLNEVVVTGIAGKLAVFDTDAVTPDPAPRTWIQRYSENRRGVAEYVPPPGPKVPKLFDIVPSDGAENVSLNTPLSVRAYDFQKTLLNITFWMKSGDDWILLEEFQNVPNGVYSVHPDEYVVDYNTSYQWRVRIEDPDENIDQRYYDFSTGLPNQWLMPGWSFRKQVTVSKDMVYSDLVDFPVLISISDPDLIGNINEDGSDLLFTLSDGETMLDSEIESIDSQNGSVVVWVKVPELMVGEDSVLYMYYGNDAASMNASSALVWSEGYASVYHMSDDSVSMEDSLMSVNGTLLNGVGRDTGLIGSSLTFDGVNDYVLGSAPINAGSSFTVSSWFKPYSEPSKNWNVIGQYGSECGNGFGWLMRSGWYANPSFLMRNETAYTITSSYDIGQNSWHQLVAVFDGNTVKLYIDGILKETRPFSGSVCEVSSTGFYVGKFYSDYLYGSVDEIEISSVARSDDYVRTSYTNQKDPGSLISLGLLEMSACGDSDGDGFSPAGYVCGPVDCDDSDGSAFPGAEEICGDLVDNNCDGVIDEGCECVVDSDCDGGGSYCSGSLWLNDSYSCLAGACVLKNTTELMDCSDGFACNGMEQCIEGGYCMDGSPIDCTPFSVAAISSCEASPDDNPFTFDFAEGFDSTCLEPTGECTTSNSNLTHSCNFTFCGAECDGSTPCPDTDCNVFDACVGFDYYDYEDIVNACLDSCVCESNTCGNATVYLNDSRCLI
ncbi:DUF2341 domain-containing protein [Candidatus Woesearchaeota archaeon]|nr:DUF2341 domain-containing protein [Candidatus Woesearchaeota archaeon]